MNEKLLKVKGEVVALIVLVPLALVLGLVIWQWPGSAQLGGGEEVSRSEKREEDVKEREVAGGSDTVGSGVKGDRSSLRSADENILETQGTQRIVNLEIVVDDQLEKFDVEAGGGETVDELLVLAQEQHGLLVERQDYGGTLGVIITGMDGLKNNDRANHYWFLYINEELSLVGASTAVVKAGDRVRWKYEESNYEME